MKRLLVVSLRRGCGSTTVTANLAQSLVKINKPVLAIDVSAENLLRLHFGTPYDENDGWAVRMMGGALWNEAGFSSPQGVDFLPYGQSNEILHQSFTQTNNQPINDLNQGLLSVCEPSQWQLFHGEFWQISTPVWQDFIASMDMIFVVIKADAMNYAVLQSLFEHNHVLRELMDNDKIRFILNQYQPETEIGRDLALVLKQELKTLLVPVLMHQDTALIECAANLTTIQHYSPISQAAKDYQALAFWCVSAFTSAAEQG